MIMDNTQLATLLDGWIAKNYHDVKLPNSIYQRLVFSDQSDMFREYHELMKRYIVKHSPKKADELNNKENPLGLELHLDKFAKKVIAMTDHFVSDMMTSNTIDNFEIDIIVLHDSAQDQQLSTIYWCLLISLVYYRLVKALSTELAEYITEVDPSLDDLLKIAFTNRIVKARVRAEIQKFDRLKTGIHNNHFEIDPRTVYTMISLLEVLEFGK